VRVARAVRLRGGAGTAFREPQFYENFTTAFTVGNPALRPERTRSWEIGGSYDLPRDATLSASYFNQRFTNMIDYTSSPPTPGGANYYNIARASATGVELEAHAPGPLSLALDAAYTRLWTRVLDRGFDPSAGALLVRGARLLRRPTHSASVALTYQRADRGSIHLRVQRVGDRDDRDYSGAPAPARLGWYTRIDLGGELRVSQPRAGIPGAALSLRVENLANKAYQTVYGFAAPGRSILGGVRLDF
jgi:vitamin B12 transporter